VRKQYPSAAIPTWRKAAGAEYTSDVDVDLQRVIESAGGDFLSDFPLPDTHLDGSVGEE